MQTAPEDFRAGNEQLDEAVRTGDVAPVRLIIQRMSEEIQKDVEMMGTLRQAGVQPGVSVVAEAGGLGVRPVRGRIAGLRDRSRGRFPPVRDPGLIWRRGER